MTTNTFQLDNDEGLSDQRIENCRNSLGWSVWAFDLALEAVTFPVSELAEEVKADPEYAQRIIAIYQMMHVERACSAAREHLAAEIVDRLRTTLQLAGRLPAGHPLDTPIDFMHVPATYGIHPDNIHFLRPDIQMLR